MTRRDIGLLGFRNERWCPQIGSAENRRRIQLDGSLQIISLYKYDGGTYVCTADNGLGPPVRAEYQLVVTGTCKACVIQMLGLVALVGNGMGMNLLF